MRVVLHPPALEACVSLALKHLLELLLKFAGGRLPLELSDLSADSPSACATTHLIQEGGLGRAPVKQCALLQLRLGNCNFQVRKWHGQVHFRSFGWQIATFKYEAYRAGGRQSLERTCAYRKRSKTFLAELAAAAGLAGGASFAFFLSVCPFFLSLLLLLRPFLCLFPFFPSFLSCFSSVSLSFFLSFLYCACHELCASPCKSDASRRACHENWLPRCCACHAICTSETARAAVQLRNFPSPLRDPAQNRACLRVFRMWDVAEVF